MNSTDQFYGRLAQGDGKADLSSDWSAEALAKEEALAKAWQDPTNAQTELPVNQPDVTHQVSGHLAKSRFHCQFASKLT